MGDVPQRRGGGAGLLQETDVRRVVRAVAEKLGVLAEFDDVVSGRGAVRALLDSVDLVRAEREARGVAVGVCSGHAAQAHAGGVPETHAVFSQRERRFTEERGAAEGAGEYAFDVGPLDRYEHRGAAGGYGFCREDGSWI